MQAGVKVISLGLVSLMIHSVRPSGAALSTAEEEEEEEEQAGFMRGGVEIEGWMNGWSGRGWSRMESDETCADRQMEGMYRH